MKARKGLLVTLFLLPALVVATSASGSKGTHTQEYAGFTPLGDCVSNLIGEPNMGVVCFDLDGTETTVDLSIQDEYQPNVAGVYKFFTPIRITSGAFCNSISGIKIPLGAYRLSVNPSGEHIDGFDLQPTDLGTIASCSSSPGYHPPVKGTVTASLN